MIKVKIEKLVFGGMGLARTSSGIFLIPGVLPGEVVNITPESRSSGVQIASVKEIEIRSDERREPPCRYFGKCGGCDWQYIVPQKQLLFKKEIFSDCFSRIGGLDIAVDIQLFSSPEFDYRIRGQLKINDDGCAGFYRRKSNEVIPITSCPLLFSGINNLFAHNYSSLLNNQCKTIKVIQGDNSLASFPVLDGLSVPDVNITVNKWVFKVNGGDFFQSNRFLNEKLGLWVLPFIGGNLCVDLYGGCGFFSLMVSEHFKKGLLIESVESQVKKANLNFECNKADHFRAITTNAENLLSFCSKQPDLVIVDPPRPGLTRKVMNVLAALKPKKILYISCNVSTQARDSAFLVKSAGYNISQIALFDCYPNTFHLESAILFVL